MSRSLAGATPDRPAVLPGNHLPPFFAGLLPEGRHLSAARRATGTSADDEFTLLLAVGMDTVGDVAVVPEGAPPEPEQRPEPADPTTTTWADLFARAVGLPLDEAAPAPLRDRAALPGMTDKLSGRMIALPAALHGTEVILKLEPPEFPHLVANEAFFLRRAGEAGLRAATATVLHDRDGTPALAVTRFDRQHRDGTLGRIAVEDAAQLLGRVPGDKYRIDTVTAVNALARTCPAQPVALKELFEQLVFAYLSGNSDLHAKNLAVLGDGTATRIAPAYDLPSAFPYPLDLRLALPIDGHFPSEVPRNGWLRIASTIGLPERAAIRSLERLARHASTWPELVDAELELDSDRRHTLLRRLRYRLRSIAA